MSQVIVQSKALLEPRLLLPAKKPIGLVEIDAEHPHAKGLSDLWLNGSPAPVNIGFEGRFDGQITGSSGTIGKKVYDGVGWGAPANTAGYYTKSLSGHRLNEGVDGWSLAIHFYFNVRPPTLTNDVFQLGGTSNGIKVTLNGDGHASPNSIEVDMYGGSGQIISAAGAIPEKKAACLVITHGAKDGYLMYLDGKQVASGSYVSGNGSHTNNLFELFGTGTSNCDFLIYSIAFWQHKEIGARAARSISVDPYQYLKPVGMVSDLSFIGVSADEPPPTYNIYWMSWF